MTRKEVSVLLGLIFTIVFSVCFQDIKSAEMVRQNTLRLHVIANSNSLADQQTKLAVRDLILDMTDDMSTESTDFNQALKNTENIISEIEKTVNSFLNQQKTGYTACCSVENFTFDTTQYDGFVLPKGEYTALTVRLGKAEGKNWWCVLYPALCSQSCGEIALEENADFIKTDKITPRFKVVELYEDIKQRISPNKTEQYKNLD